jgi:ssDNA-binding Zn-finger/Zn-ribbon topoisomerase 1
MADLVKACPKCGGPYTVVSVEDRWAWCDDQVNCKYAFNPWHSHLMAAEGPPAEKPEDLYKREREQAMARGARVLRKADDEMTDIQLAEAKRLLDEDTERRHESAKARQARGKLRREGK